MELLDLELTHEQQQAVVEEIQKPMAEEVSCAEAIIIVAQKIRETTSINDK